MTQVANTQIGKMASIVLGKAISCETNAKVTPQKELEALEKLLTQWATLLPDTSSLYAVEEGQINRDVPDESMNPCPFLTLATTLELRLFLESELRHMAEHRPSELMSRALTFCVLPYR